MRGPLQLKGGVYLIDRGSETVAPDYLGGHLVARLESMLQFRFLNEWSVGNKGTQGVSWGRVSGDTVDLRAHFTDHTELFMSVATNWRSDELNFNPSDEGKYRIGHMMRDTNLSSIIIRDMDAPLANPALYIPYAMCTDPSWFIMRSARLLEAAEMSMASVWYDNSRPPFEWGDISKFWTPEEEEGEPSA